MFHPKIIHTDHSSIQFLHRRDPSVGRIMNGGYPQPLINLKPKPELRITEEEFNKWREEQFAKALEERRRLQEAENAEEPIEDEEEEDYIDDKKSNNDDDQDDLYKKHKANKANSTLGRKETLKHKNHNYQQDYESTNYEKTYANNPRWSGEKAKNPQQRPPQSDRKPVEKSRKQPPQRFGFVRNPDTQTASSVNKPQYVEQAASDPTSYTTIPKDQRLAAPLDYEDDIYSGLLSNRYDKKTVVKSKLLADINYNRKKQTKAIAASLLRRSQ